MERVVPLILKQERPAYKRGDKRIKIKLFMRVPRVTINLLACLKST
jgi:hypothetical protein